MDLVLKRKDSEIIKEFAETWPVGFCSSRFTPELYNSVLSIVLSSITFEQQARMTDIKLL